ncbi:MAG: ribose-phosphate diphosphokinase [Candidatus Dojkabacteria bacterium]
MPPRVTLSILACHSGKHLAKKIVKKLSPKTKRGVKLIDSTQTIFASTEIKNVVNESIRGKDVYIIQDTENHSEGMSVDENLRSLYTSIDACRRCDARRITVVIPSYPYARQDKQDGREGITAARVAWELEGEMGADHIITVDLHNSAIQGFFRRAKIDNLRGGFVLIPYLRKLITNPEETTIIPTDLGGAKRANYFAQSLCTGIAFAYKERNYSRANCVEKIEILGEVKNKDVYIVDDMIDTGGTLIRAIERAKEKGARKIHAVCTLALLNGPAIENFSRLYKEGMIDSVIGTDATYHTKEMLKENKWFKELSIDEYLAEIIFRINRGRSIGEMLM